MRLFFAPRFSVASGTLLLLFFLLAGTFSATIVTPGSAVAAEQAKLSAEMDQALDGLLNAAGGATSSPSPADMDVVLRYVATSPKGEARQNISERPEGAGIYRHTTLDLPFQKLLGYIVNPGVPGEVLGAAGVRVNIWYPESDVLNKAAEFRNTPLPPASPVVLRGKEYEETTPDVSSGGYYSYKLNRLFVLTSYQGRSVLFSISRMPEKSSVGKKGAIVGNDDDWTYVYTPENGTNLSMVGWADTYLYGSATVSLFVESAPGSDKVDMYIFKWAKAGWSGMNVVKADHLHDGVERFIKTLSLVLESPRAPSSDDIAAYRKQLLSLDEATLKERLKSFGADLNARSKGDPLLSEKDFQAVLSDDKYVASLSRQQAFSELMKLYMRKQLGKPVPSGY